MNRTKDHFDERDYQMREMRPSSEDEVVAAFLRAEIGSPRWSPTLRAMLTRDRLTPRVLEHPNFASAEENVYRRRLLGEFRGWGRNTLLLRGFPSDFEWSLVSVRRDELAKIKYINWPYWVEISGGTRLAKEAARRIRAGLAEEHRASYEQVANRVKAGETLPELIVVTGPGPADPLVAVEGHARLTGYFLAEDALPDSLDLFIGRSASVRNWGLY
jgi:hypothetical protein